MKIKITGATRFVPKFEVGQTYASVERKKVSYLVDAYGGLIEISKLKDVQIEWEEVNV